jgi:hypothetical protein
MPEDLFYVPAWLLASLCLLLSVPVWRHALSPESWRERVADTLHAWTARRSTPDAEDATQKENQPGDATAAAADAHQLGAALRRFDVTVSSGSSAERVRAWTATMWLLARHTRRGRTLGNRAVAWTFVCFAVLLVLLRLWRLPLEDLALIIPFMMAVSLGIVDLRTAGHAVSRRNRFHLVLWSSLMRMWVLTALVTLAYSLAYIAVPGVASPEWFSAVEFLALQAALLPAMCVATHVVVKVARNIQRPGRGASMMPMGLLQLLPLLPLAVYRYHIVAIGFLSSTLQVSPTAVVLLLAVASHAVFGFEMRRRHLRLDIAWAA